MPEEADPRIANVGSGAAATQGGVASGAGGIAVGGDVDGGIHYHAAPGTGLLRPAPPAPPPHFTGREAELDRFAQRLTSGENVAITALQGLGGIGKTALAQKLAERIRPQFPGGVLWWSLGPQPDVITALDVWARHADPRADLSQFPTAESRASVVRSMLAKLGRLCAILGDAWQADAARALMSAVPPGCPILITTRDGDFAKELHCKVERIDALNADEAVALLAKLLGPLDGHTSAARDIATLTEGLPLALELIAGLADAPADLTALAKKLREKPALNILKMPGGETREKSVEACLALSYDKLDADMQRRFRALGVFAPAPFERDAIAALWGDEDEETVEQAIRHLMRRNLLSETLAKAAQREPSQGSEPEYRQHALLRAYALALLHPSPRRGGAGGEVEDEFHIFSSRHADYYRRFAGEKDWRAVEKAFEQIDWGWRWVQAHAADQIIDLVFALQHFLDRRGRKAELLKWLDKGLTHSQTVSDRKREGTFLNNIGGVHDALGQKDKALDFFQQALAISREVGDRGGEGATLNNIGGVHDDLGQKDKALDFYQQALAIRREVGDRSGEGTTLNNIGRVHDDLGQKDKALDFYQQALAIRREVGDRWGESVTLFNIGMALDELGRTAEAITYLEQAVALDEASGHPDLESDRAKLEELWRKVSGQQMNNG
jgi:tetratricopeptide (TPR) repeat protein